MGGILGADSFGTVVTFYFDESGTTTLNQYIPDIRALNSVIAKWFLRGLFFAGFVHTHDKHMPKLSWADVNYAQKIKKACHMEAVLMLVYIPETGTFHQYTV